MEYILSSYSTKGNVRKNNQDSCCIFRANTSRGEIAMAIVCDGMGGLSFGEYASSTVISRFSHWFERELVHIIKHCTIQEICSEWIKILNDVDIELKQYGADKGTLVGTTFSGIFFLENNCLKVHIGDSRIYQIRNKKLYQITTDHTVYARNLALGITSEDESENKKNRSKLTQCIGASKYMEPEVSIYSVSDLDGMLLCSDGYYHHMSEKTIISSFYPLKIKDTGKLYRICEETVHNVIEKGEKDNISVILIKLKKR